MQIQNLDGNLLSLEGKPLADKTGAVYTVRALCSGLLLTDYEHERLSGPEKYKRFELASKIHKAGESVEVESEDITLIKKLAGHSCTPVLIGPFYDHLEGKAE